MNNPSEKHIDHTYYNRKKEKAEEIERKYERIDGKLVLRVDYIDKEEPKKLL